jgi:hypothetical protein
VLKVASFVVWTRKPQGLRAPGEFRLADRRVAVIWLEAREREFHDAYQGDRHRLTRPARLAHPRQPHSANW